MRRSVRFSVLVLFITLLLVGLGLLVACGSSTPAATTNYNGSASVGDLVTITIDRTAHTLTYQNLTNNQSGTSIYTVNADGSYGSFSDPNLVRAREIPNYAVFLQVKNAGSNAQTQALVTAPVQVTLTNSTFNSQNFNFIQFRTAGGGTHAGWISVDSSGNLSGNAYRPWQNLDYTLSLNGVITPFKSVVADGAINLATAAVSANGYLTAPQGPKNNYVFGTQNGLFLVDSPKGTSLGLPKASSAAFNASFAGTYSLMYFSKAVTAIVLDSTGAETGTPTMDVGSISFDASGNATLKDSGGNTVWQGLLQPFSTAANIPAGLGDPCNGLFTARVTSGGKQKDLFVGFLAGQNGAPNVTLVSFFSSASPIATDQSYSYMYGVGVAQ